MFGFVWTSSIFACGGDKRIRLEPAMTSLMPPLTSASRAPKPSPLNNSPAKFPAPYPRPPDAAPGLGRTQHKARAVVKRLGHFIAGFVNKSDCSRRLLPKGQHFQRHGLLKLPQRQAACCNWELRQQLPAFHAFPRPPAPLPLRLIRPQM